MWMVFLCMVDISFPHSRFTLSLIRYQAKGSFLGKVAQVKSMVVFCFACLVLIDFCNAQNNSEWLVKAKSGCKKTSGNVASTDRPRYETKEHSKPRSLL